MAIETFPGYVPPMTEGPARSPAFLGETDRTRQNKYIEAWNDIRQRGWKPATVIQMQPWDLTLDGPVHQERKIPGVPVDEEVWARQQPRIELKGGISIPFTYHVILAPYITVNTHFEGSGATDNYASISSFIDLPITIARDCAQQQNRYRSQGGIFAYVGAELPFTIPDHQKLEAWVDHNESKSMPEAAELAFERMTLHMNALVSQAEMAYAGRNEEKMREIAGRRHFKAVQYLMNCGKIQKPPDWFTERYATGSKSKSVNCPSCRTRCAADAQRCTCGYILDPFDAYGKLYTEESEGGMLTARRMSKEQLTALGLYPRIKPHLEWVAEKNELAKAVAKAEANKKG